MVLKRTILVSLFSFLFSFQVLANPQNIEEARVFIDKFQELSHKYDKKLTEMYSENAKIIRIVEHKNGKTEEITLPAKAYKKMLKFIRFLAKIRGYKNYYKYLKYESEDENIRITGIRETNSGYTAPISILIGKNSEGNLKILEEKTATKSKFLIKQVLKRAK